MEKYISTLNKISKEKKRLLKKLIRSYMNYCSEDAVAFVVHQKCVHHYLKSNLDEKLIERMSLQDHKKVKLVESIMEKAFGELSLKPANTKYLILAGWGMLSGAMIGDSMKNIVMTGVVLT